MTPEEDDVIEAALAVVEMWKSVGMRTGNGTELNLLIHEVELVESVANLRESRNPDPWILLEELLLYCNRWVGNGVIDEKFTRERVMKALKWNRDNNGS